MARSMIAHDSRPISLKVAWSRTLAPAPIAVPKGAAAQLGAARSTPWPAAAPSSDAPSTGLPVSAVGWRTGGMWVSRQCAGRHGVAGRREGSLPAARRALLRCQCHVRPQRAARARPRRAIVSLTGAGAPHLGGWKALRARARPCAAGRLLSRPPDAAVQARWSQGRSINGVGTPAEIEIGTHMNVTSAAQCFYAPPLHERWGQSSVR